MNKEDDGLDSQAHGEESSSKKSKTDPVAYGSHSRDENQESASDTPVIEQLTDHSKISIQDADSMKTSHVEKTTRLILNPMPDVNVRKMMRPGANQYTVPADSWQHEKHQPNKLSEDERNKLSARMLKAELTGDKIMYEQLKSQLEMDKVTYSEPDIPSGTMMHVSTKVSSAQHAIHHHHRHDQHTKRGKGESEVIPTLDEIVREAKMSSASPDLMYAKQIMKNPTFRNTLDHLDEHSESLALKKSPRDPEKSRDKRRLTQARQHTNIHPCKRCEPNELNILAASHHWMLVYPSFVSFVPQSVQLIPVIHTSTTLSMDEDAMEDLRNFKKSLLHMYHTLHLGAIFIETVTSTKRHTVIDCIPVSQSFIEKARICFTKSFIEEGDEETRKNKRLVTFDQSSRFGAHGRIPAHFPFICVEFNLGHGLIHPIENVKTFSRHFAFETIGGLLNLEPQTWRKPQKLSDITLRDGMAAFSALYDAHDWTKLLYEKESSPQESTVK